MAELGGSKDDVVGDGDYFIVENLSLESAIKPFAALGVAGPDGATFANLFDLAFPLLLGISWPIFPTLDRSSIGRDGRKLFSFNSAWKNGRLWNLGGMAGL